MNLLFANAVVVFGTGEAPARADVRVVDGRIAEVAASLEAAGSDVIDLDGKALLPGLFDCHVHVAHRGLDRNHALDSPFSYRFFEAVRNLESTLRAGVTTVRDAGGADAGMRQAVADGLIDGPRLHISVTALSQTGGHADAMLACGINLEDAFAWPGMPSPLVDGPVECRLRVRELKRVGADVIKICTTGGVLSAGDDLHVPQLRPDELEAIVSEATAQDTHVMAHAHSPRGISNALAAGVRSIEHGVFLSDENIEQMVRQGTWLVPTLGAPQAVIEQVAAGAVVPAGAEDRAAIAVEAHQDAVRRAHRAGVRIAMGTDAAVTPHGTNLRELALMQACGMSPDEVLHAATGSAADLLDVAEDRGRIQPGLRADFAIVDGDPHDLATLPDRVSSVWLDGRRAGRS